MESRHEGQSYVLQRFVPAELKSQYESRIQHGIRRLRSVQRVVGQDRVRAVLISALVEKLP